MHVPNQGNHQDRDWCIIASKQDNQPKRDHSNSSRESLYQVHQPTHRSMTQENERGKWQKNTLHKSLYGLLLGVTFPNSQALETVEEGLGGKGIWGGRLGSIVEQKFIQSQWDSNHVPPAFEPFALITMPDTHKVCKRTHYVLVSGCDWSTGRYHFKYIIRIYRGRKSSTTYARRTIYSHASTYKYRHTHMNTLTFTYTYIHSLQILCEYIYDEVDVAILVTKSQTYSRTLWLVYSGFLPGGFRRGEKEVTSDEGTKRGKESDQKFWLTMGFEPYTSGSRTFRLNRWATSPLITQWDRLA